MADQIRLLVIEDVPQVASHMRSLLQAQSQIKMLDVVTKTPGVWITTVGEVAAHHASSANASRYVVQSRTPAPIASRRFKGAR